MIDVVPLLAAALALIVGLVGLRALIRHQLSRAYDRMEHGRWEPTHPDGRHEPMRPIVEALQAEGYVCESFTVLTHAPRPVPAVVLGHADGSTATVTVYRGLSNPVLMVELKTVLVPGARWLSTFGSRVAKLDGTGFSEMAVRRPDVGATVARHRASRAWLADRGITLHPVALGQAGRDQEAEMRALARLRLQVGLARMVTVGTRRDDVFRPLWDRSGIEAQLAALRWPSGPPT